MVGLSTSTSTCMGTCGFICGKTCTYRSPVCRYLPLKLPTSTGDDFGIVKLLAEYLHATRHPPRRQAQSLLKICCFATIHLRLAWRSSTAASSCFQHKSWCEDVLQEPDSRYSLATFPTFVEHSLTRFSLFFCKWQTVVMMSSQRMMLCFSSQCRWSGCCFGVMRGDKKLMVE